MTLFVVTLALLYPSKCLCQTVIVIFLTWHLLANTTWTSLLDKLVDSTWVLYKWWESVLKAAPGVKEVWWCHTSCWSSSQPRTEWRSVDTNYKVVRQEKCLQALTRQSVLPTLSRSTKCLPVPAHVPWAGLFLSCFKPSIYLRPTGWKYTSITTGKPKTEIFLQYWSFVDLLLISIASLTQHRTVRYIR